MRGQMVERALRWCAVGLSIAAVVCGVASVISGSREVVVSGSLIVVAVVLGLADFICIAVLGFMEVHSQLRKRTHPIA